MRGGRFQQRAQENANTRNAEGLFESRTVQEIREVEIRTRKDIEEKKEELRQLVGASYRDLIESADSILDMRRSCEAVCANITTMEKGFATLHKSIPTALPAPGREESRQRREKLFGIGSRVKYLVDTPEKIWGCLDEHLYMEGAERYMRAREVHSLLEAAAREGEQREMLTCFPLLKHQWPLVETFRSHIVQRGNNRLLEPNLPISDYAIALAASAIIDDLDSTQVFALFLDCRRAWIRSLLRSTLAPRGGGGGGTAAGPVVDVAACFSRIVEMIKLTLCHIGELFYEGVSTKSPLLFSTVLTAPPASQLFGGIPAPDAEVSLWKEHRDRLESLMTPLAAILIKDKTQAWLETCKEDVAAEGSVLLGQVSTAQSLATIEGSIRAEVAHSNTIAASSEWLAAAYGAIPESPWDCICDLILRQSVDLWRALFEQIFLDRTKAILDGAFAALSIRPELEERLAKVEGSSALDGARSNRWAIAEPPEDDMSWKPQLKARWGLVDVDGLTLGASGKLSSSMVMSPVAPPVTGVGADVAQLRDLLDERLVQVVQDTLPMLRTADGAVNRTSTLAPYLQEKCFSAVTEMVEGLGTRLKELAGSGPGSGASESRSLVVEQALLIGRFCAAIGQGSKLLPIILGPPNAWNMVAAPGSLGSLSRSGSLSEAMNGGMPTPERPSPFRRRLSRHASGEMMGQKQDPGSAKLREVQRLLRRVSVDAHRVWVDFSTQQLAAALEADLRADDTLGTAVPLKGWEETVIKEVEEGKEVDMRISLPATPSHFTALLLYAACREVHRIGSHSLDKAVLRLFSWQLAQKTLDALERFVGDPASTESAVSEKGVLQLLFDVKFVADVLAGGSDISSGSLEAEDEDGGSFGSSSFSATSGGGGGGRRNRGGAGSDAAAQARKRRVAALLQSLCSRLDPIDWATYEQYLWQNEARHYNRCAVLFGALVQLDRLHKDVLKAPYNADTNTLNMSATCPRFSYLPISTPVLGTANGNLRGMGTSGLQADGASMASWQSLAARGSSTESLHFSFSESKENKGSISASAVATPIIIKSLMGQVGEKLGESVSSKLGSMLGESQVGRLKDKSAQVVSSFGDMLPMQATSLFSSLTAATGTSKSDTRQ